MSKMIIQFLWIICFGLTCAATAQAEVHGWATDIGKDGLNAIAIALWAVAVAIVVAAILKTITNKKSENK